MKKSLYLYLLFDKIQCRPSLHLILFKHYSKQLNLTNISEVDHLDIFNFCGTNK